MLSSFRDLHQTELHPAGSESLHSLSESHPLESAAAPSGRGSDLQGWGSDLEEWGSDLGWEGVGNSDLGGRGSGLGDAVSDPAGCRFV